LKMYTRLLDSLSLEYIVSCSHVLEHCVMYDENIFEFHRTASKARAGSTLRRTSPSRWLPSSHDQLYTQAMQSTHERGRFFIGPVSLRHQQHR